MLVVSGWGQYAVSNETIEVSMTDSAGTKTTVSVTQGDTEGEMFDKKKKFTFTLTAAAEAERSEEVEASGRTGRAEKKADGADEVPKRANAQGDSKSADAAKGHSMQTRSHTQPASDTTNKAGGSGKADKAHAAVGPAKAAKAAKAHKAVKAAKVNKSDSGTDSGTDKDDEPVAKRTRSNTPNISPRRSKRLAEMKKKKT